LVTWLKASVTGSRARRWTPAPRGSGIDLDLGDRGGKGLERALLDDDRFADLEVDVHRSGGLLGGLALLSLLLFEDRREHGEDLIEAQRHGVVGVAHEAGDTRGVADGAPRGVGQVHADQHVTGDADAVDDLALSVLDLNDFFHRNLDFEDVIFHVQGLDAGLKVGLDAVFVAGVGVDDVPVTLLAAQLGLELFGRVGGLGGSSGQDVGPFGAFLGVLSGHVIGVGLGVSVSHVIGVGLGVSVSHVVGVGLGVSVSHGVGLGVSVVFKIGVAFGIGRSRLNPGALSGLSRGVLGFIQLSLSYLELLLRHLVSCFLIA
jgi:hypothetical protein